MMNSSLLLILISLISLLPLLAFSSPSNVSFVDCLASNHISFYTRNSPNFTNVLQSYIRNSRYNLPSTRKPATILAPTTAAQVSAAVVCAKKTNTYLISRSCGHDYEGLSYVADSDFVILDMFNFRNISIDVHDESAWVDSGSQLGELYYQISKKSETLGFPAGICPTVGVGGHFSGGGYGSMLRKYGLAVDHVVDAMIVVASGYVLDRKSMGEDLFWAIRGGGGASFAVILSYKIKLVYVPPKVTVFTVYQFMSEKAAKTMYEYQQIVPTTMDPDLFLRVLLQPRTVNKTKTIRMTFIGMFLGDAQRLLNITDSVFPTLGLNATGCHEMTWIESVLYWANYDNLTATEVLLNRTSKVNFMKLKSDYVQTPISVENFTVIFNKLIEIQDVELAFNSYGGRMNEISEYATPFPHRRGNIFKIQYLLDWDNKNETRHNLYQAMKLHKFMTPYVSKNPREAYLNYRDLDIGTNKNGKYYYGYKYFKKKNFQRLVKIKTVVDPDNFFRNEQSIPTNLLPT